MCITKWIFALLLCFFKVTSLFCQEEKTTQNLTGISGGINLNRSGDASFGIKTYDNGFTQTLSLSYYYEHIFKNERSLYWGLNYDTRIGSIIHKASMLGSSSIHYNEKWISIPLLIGRTLDIPNSNNISFRGFIGCVTGLLVESNDGYSTSGGVVKSSLLLQVSARNLVGNVYIESGIKWGMDLVKYAEKETNIPFYNYFTFFLGFGTKL